VSGAQPFIISIAGNHNGVFKGNLINHSLEYEVQSSSSAQIIHSL
jgi:hypothetical protein